MNIKIIVYQCQSIFIKHFFDRFNRDALHQCASLNRRIGSALFTQDDADDPRRACPPVPWDVRVVR